jgi:SagB-type dehydrogenase family enzyme
VYCFVLDVEGVQPGLYSYDSAKHALDLISRGEFRDELGKISYLPVVMELAGACVVMVPNFPRMKFKYGERTYRFVLLEAGHIAQNMLLMAAALDVGALPLGGFVDNEMDHLIGIDGLDQAAIYAVVLGAVSEKE